MMMNKDYVEGLKNDFCIARVLPLDVSMVLFERRRGLKYNLCETIFRSYFSEKGTSTSNVGSVDVVMTYVERKDDKKRIHNRIAFYKDDKYLSTIPTILNYNNCKDLDERVEKRVIQVAKDRLCHNLVDLKRCVDCGKINSKDRIHCIECGRSGSFNKLKNHVKQMLVEASDVVRI